jgi:hypothetical protein
VRELAKLTVFGLKKSALLCDVKTNRYFCGLQLIR